MEIVTESKVQENARAPKQERLNKRQELFIEHYLNTHNGSEAVRRSGYSTKNPDVVACRLLRKRRIRELLEARYKEKFDLTREQYANEALKRADNCKQESIQKGYYEIYGKVKGYLTDHSVTVNQLAVISKTDLDQICNSNATNKIGNHTKGTIDVT